ncbi:unnamed protein product [Gongylonema pulchrum]|uniref:GPI mannosyltransferase 2 n=1 Tax=Gongylonema pulchrum TaxID=637853 RepID=A0A183EN58_9BILA|nr:unnamed protein product [Gongylonema pulchrum]
MLCFSLGVNTMYQAYTGNRVQTADGSVTQMKETYSSGRLVFIIVYLLQLYKMIASIFATIFCNQSSCCLQKNEDLEWKFTRCHIYLEYFEWYTAIPPPFNLLYNTASMIRMTVSSDYQFVIPVRIHTVLSISTSCSFIFKLLLAINTFDDFFVPLVSYFSYLYNSRRSFKKILP